MPSLKEDFGEKGAEQVVYAYFLEKGMYIGLLLLIITYLVYVSGILEPYIPLKEVPSLWSLNVANYLHHAHVPTGWAWIHLAGHGDFLNFIPVVILAGVTVLCFIAIIPVLLQQKDTIYLVLSIIEVVVLVFAASGVLVGGGH